VLWAHRLMHDLEQWPSCPQAPPTLNVSAAAAAADLLSSPLWIYSTQSGDGVIWANRAALALYGVDSAAALCSAQQGGTNTPAAAALLAATDGGTLLLRQRIGQPRPADCLPRLPDGVAGVDARLTAVQAQWRGRCCPALLVQLEAVTSSGEVSSGSPFVMPQKQTEVQQLLEQQQQAPALALVRARSAALPGASPAELAARAARLTEMCENHAMFHFLFDASGQLLAANRRAMANMRGAQRA
jgi:hypothetical protein